MIQLASIPIALFLVAYGALFCLLPRQHRAVLALASIFVAGPELDVGIGLNAPVLVAILSLLLLVVGRIRIHPPLANLLSLRLLPFFLWLIAIWVVGYLDLEGMVSARGWTRGSFAKPVVQLVRFFLLFPFAAAVADGLRSAADVRLFLRSWRRIAVASAVLCLLQVSAYQAFGTSLGVYRTHQGRFEVTFASFGDVKVPRANGLAGEPKAQGMAMAFSLCILLAAWRKGLLGASLRGERLAVGLVAAALLATVSRGAIVMTAGLAGLLLLGDGRGSGPRLSRRRAVLLLSLGVVAVSLIPGFWRVVWEKQLQRRVTLLTDPRAAGWGLDKERPAIIYLLDHPRVALTGVGIGGGPFRFDSLITVEAFRGKFVDPNSGLLWGLYGFGAVGWVLFVGGLLPLLRARGSSPEAAYPSKTLMRFVLIYFLVYTPSWWLVTAIGFACGVGTRERVAAGPPGALARAEGV